MLISTTILEKMHQRITTTAIITNSRTLTRTTITTLAIKIITLHINTNNSRIITPKTLTNKAEIEIKIINNLTTDKGITMEIVLLNNSNSLSIKIMENTNMFKLAITTTIITNTTIETTITTINSITIIKMQTINHKTDRIRDNLTTTIIIMEIIPIRIQITITKLIQGDRSNKPITMSKLILTTIRDNQNTTNNKFLISLRTKFKMARTRQVSIKVNRE